MAEACREGSSLQPRLGTARQLFTGNPMARYHAKRYASRRNPGCIITIPRELVKLALEDHERDSAALGSV